MSRFHKGEVVYRWPDDERGLPDSSKPPMSGIVTDVYSDYTSRFGPYPELYEVTWDGGIVKRGYLPHGIWK